MEGIIPLGVLRLVGLKVNDLVGMVTGFNKKVKVYRYQ